MKSIRTLLASLNSHWLALANDAELSIANSGNAAVFEIHQQAGLFVPYGDYPHEKGLQKFDRAAAESLKEAANSLLGRTVGIPIYAGHPDLPGRPDSNPAAPAYGWIADIEVSADGATFIPKWNKRGLEAIENAEFRFYSPYWLLKKVSGGLSPVRMKSMGLTNSPRIPVPAIANDQPENQPEKKEPTPMNEEILKLLSLANDATPEAIKARIKVLADAETELTALKPKLEKAENDLTLRTTEVAAANDRATRAEARATATRERLVDTTLDRVIGSGRLAESDRATRRTELLGLANDADLTTRLSELDAAAPTLKTTPVTAGLGGSGRAALAAENDAVLRSEKRQTAIAEELKAIANDVEPGTRYDLAFSRAQQKHPELFTTPAASAS